MKAGGKKLKDTRGPQQFIYYMSMLDGSPCTICLIQPLCKKSYMDDSACDALSEFIKKYVEEKEHANQD